MAINSDTDINIAIMQLGKQANFYRLDQSITPHKIIEWGSDNTDSQPTDDELNAAYIEWKNTEQYKEQREDAYPDWQTQLDYIYHNGVDKWKTDLIDPIKNKYPKP